MLIADYFNVTLDFLFARPVTEKEYSGTLLAFEEALMKEGISDKTFNLPTRNMFFEFILKQTSYFIKLVTHQPQPPKIKAVAKSSRVALRNVDYGKRTFAMEIAERIKSLSKGKGLTYSRALAELGYHPSFLTNMTSAGSIPVADSLLPLADYFDVSVDFLLGRTKKDVEYPRLLKGFENMLKCQGITDDSIAPEDDDLYFELLSKQTETFIRMRALRNSNDKSDSENNNTSL
jgi:transcriptional regulator with XRE-family HTH domain